MYFQFFFLKNLVDRDLTEYQITQTLTLSRLHAPLEQTKGIRLFTHTQHVDWSRQGVIRVFNHPLEQTSNPSLNLLVKCSANPICADPWSESMAGTAWLRSRHRRCFSCWILVCVVCVGKPGQREQIVDISVPQNVEEIAEVSKSLIVCTSILNLYFLTKSKCFWHELV